MRKEMLGVNILPFGYSFFPTWNLKIPLIPPYFPVKLGIFFSFVVHLLLFLILPIPFTSKSSVLFFSAVFSFSLYSHFLFSSILLFSLKVTNT